MTLEQALEKLRKLGFDDVKLTGVEKKAPGGETLLEYTTEYPDSPVLIRSSSGEIRIEPWDYRRTSRL